ncbi:MAG: adenylate/guanylate cyclase domain-containing protein [Cyanobacteria bacterium P01_G01_bin.54]
MIAERITTVFSSFPKLPLRLLLIVPFSLQILAAVGLTGILSLRNGQRLVQDLAGQLSAQTSEQVTNHVQGYLETSELMLQVNGAAVQTGSLNVKNFDQLQAYFWRQSQLSESVTTLYYGAATGDFLQVEMGQTPTLALRTVATAPAWEIFRLDAQGDRRERLRTGLYDPRLRPWYKKAARLRRLTWSSVYLFADPPVLGITPALPLYEADGRLQGVMAIDLPLSQLSEFLAGLEIGQTGSAFIMEPDGSLIASSVGESMVIATEDAQSRRTLGQSEHPLLQMVATHLAATTTDWDPAHSYQQVLRDAQGRRYFFYLTAVDNAPGIDWRLGILIPQQDFQAAFARNNYTTLVVCAIALVVSAGVGLLLTSLLVDPLGRFVQASQALATGDFETTLPEGKIREFDRLSRAFNRMRNQLQEAFASWASIQATLTAQAKREAAALQLSQERFTKVFQASPDAIAICAFETGKILEVNFSFLRITGYDTTEVLDQTLATLNLWHLPGEDRSILEVAQDQGQVHDQTVTFTSATGELRWAQLAAEVIAIRDQLCWVFIASDITPLKQAEAQLRQQQQYLWLILNNIPQQVFWKDTQSVFVGCNRNWAIASGLDAPEQVIGKTDHDLVSPAAAERYRTEDTYVIQNDEPILHQLDIKQKSQTGSDAVIWLDVTKIPLHDEAGNVIGLMGVLEDITDRKRATEALKAEQAKSEQLLLNILPQTIAQQLKQQQAQNFSPSQRNLLAQNYEQATILFADLAGFTVLCQTLPPIELVTLLNEIFSAFDRLAEQYGLEKIKTIGDAYMVAAGLPMPCPDHGAAIADMALAMQTAMQNLQPQTLEPCEIRIGIHTGSVIAGVIGLKKFSYDLWGDTVNTASRMEMTGEANRIQVSAAVYEMLKTDYTFEERGWIEVKGKGQMRTYWLTGKG